MKKRRHHNNKGYRQIKRDRCRISLARIVKRLKLLKEDE
jgi:hypothetical protein